jgi:hypothetical protein
MFSKILDEIIEKVKKEHPSFGKIKITLVFHNDQFTGFNFTKKEKHLLIIKGDKYGSK